MKIPAPGKWNDLMLFQRGEVIEKIYSNSLEPRIIFFKQYILLTE